MSNIKIIPIDVINELKKLVDNNINPNKIIKELEEKFGEKFSYQTIKKKIEKLFNKYWDKKEKKYKIILQPQSQISFFEKNSNDAGNSHASSNTNKQTIIKNITKSTSLTVLDYLREIDKKLDYLNSRLTKIENYIEKNSPQAKKELVESFIDIYSSNKDRETVNINSELKKRIIEKMGQKRNIHGNQSHAINTALLIALYNDE